MPDNSMFGGTPPKMVDLKRPKESLKPQNIGKISPDPYSYDHRISLDADAMNKLGMDTLPQVGDEFHGHFKAHVKSVSERSDAGTGPQGKSDKRVELQIHHLGMAAQEKNTGALGAVNKGIDEAGK
jgi:hypothetical protein